MGFREQLSQMKREYRKEATKLDDKIEQLAQKMDAGLGAIQKRLGGAEKRLGGAEKAIGDVEKAVRVVHLHLQVTRDEMTATNEAVGQVRGDLQESLSAPGPA